ncbi:hypothetical protein [Pseudomonas sp. PvP027]|uniref:hypothetical protein n=1 Tax=Pseudomonas sp. PvP027 TaxID=2806587 RepID=UPI001AE98F99|nr:hypothetical protein [Pseudomonas sp. PvP027]
MTQMTSADAVHTVKIPAGAFVYKGGIRKSRWTLHGWRRYKADFGQDPWMSPGVEVIGLSVSIK